MLRAARAVVHLYASACRTQRASPPPAPCPPQLTGAPLPSKRFYGKPNAPTYRLLEKMLAEVHDCVFAWVCQCVCAGHVPLIHLHLGFAGRPTAHLPAIHPTQQAAGMGLELPPPPPGATSPFGAIWAVGDNPRSDVRGANAAGAPWVSVLVRTGVAKENDPADPAQASLAVLLSFLPAFPSLRAPWRCVCARVWRACWTPHLLPYSPPPTLQPARPPTYTACAGGG